MMTKKQDKLIEQTIEFNYDLGKQHGKKEVLKFINNLLIVRRRQQSKELSRYNKETERASKEEDKSQYDYSDEWRSRTVSILDELDWLIKEIGKEFKK